MISARNLIKSRKEMREANMVVDHARKRLQGVQNYYATKEQKHSQKMKEYFQRSNIYQKYV
jgi:hypothetical protein